LNPLLLLIAIPSLIAVLGLFPRTARWLPGASAVLFLLQIPVAAVVCLPVFMGQVLDYGLLGLDGVGSAFTVITTLAASAAMIQGAMTLPATRLGEYRITDRRFCLFYSLSGLFVVSMYVVPLAQHLGLLWVAVEATTLMSVPLISYHQSRASLEATWKYLLLCSVGIALALFGTSILLAAQISPMSSGLSSLVSMLTHAGLLDERLLRVGFLFCLLGYGTKAGIFPLHNWLPDAHSEAPAVVSAMLSGALLNCALVAIWRLAQVLQAAGQAELVQQVLVPAGAITVVAASLILIRQHDLKRMLAYSSVEHVGLLTLAIGIGSGPLFILHALNHTLAKVALFLIAGTILHVYGSKSLLKLNGILKTTPILGILLLAASFAIAGSPPFGPFLSEWLLLRETLDAGELAAVTAVLAGLTVAFIAISTHVGRIVFGLRQPAVASNFKVAWIIIPAALLVISLALGTVLPPYALQMLTQLLQTGVR
jgi:hydrogenase-4 component F